VRQRDVQTDRLLGGDVPIALTNFLAATGWTQFGYRYALDFYPFLFLLTIKVMGPGKHAYLFVLLSVIVNLWAVLSVCNLVPPTRSLAVFEFFWHGPRGGRPLSS
jgi:uncharacterized membrane protein